MNVRFTLRYAATAVVAAACCGCATSQPTFRGQSPVVDPGVQPASLDDFGGALESAHEGATHALESAGTLVSGGHHHGHPAYTTYHNLPPAGPGTGYGFHHEGYADGYCPPEYGHGCPPGNCQQHFMPRHVQSYSYDRPSDLVYPQPNSTGGAIVYPYYTHKGPSDFFRP